MPLTAIAGLDYMGATLRHRIAEREFGEEDEKEEVAARRRAQAEEQDGFEPGTDVTTDTHGGGVFLTVTLEPTEKLAVTAAGRFDITDLKIKDRLAANGDEDRTTDASGSHRFDRFNPAIGATYSLLSNLSLYANYSESYRAPTAIELTCANPEAPCPIPTAIVDDPPLDPVKGKTWEGRLGCGGRRSSSSMRL